MRGYGCLEGKEGLVVDELAKLIPAARPVTVRPGFVLLEDPGLDPALTIAAPVHPAFARAEFTVWGELRGRGPRAAADRLAPLIVEATEPEAALTLHVWTQAADDRDARNGEAKVLERALRRALGARASSRVAADMGADVIDVVCVGRHEYVLGAHRRSPLMSAYPGGQRRLTARPDAPSRAHLKLEEGLEWAELPVREGDVAVDVGCAPGGWSLILLERGLFVHGVDPTPVAAAIRHNARFVEHRGPVRKFDPTAIPALRWLFCDMNGPPLAAVGQVERMLGRAPGLEAAFHTIKLSDDPPLPTLSEVKDRFRVAGFADVCVRHLYHNREELTLVARRAPRQTRARVI